MKSNVITDTIAPADVAQLASDAERDARAFVLLNKVDVVDLGTLERAVAVRTAVGEKKQAIVAQLAKPKKWAYDLHRWFCGLETAACKPLDELDVYERRQITDFKAAADRARQQREREEAEQRRRDDEARAAAEAAALEASGEADLAAAVIEEALAAPTPVVALPDETKQIDGLKFRRRWLWRYQHGPRELKDTPPHVLARAMELIPRTYLCVDEQKIGAVVRSSKGTIAIPGVDIYFVDEPVR